MGGTPPPSLILKKGVITMTSLISMMIIVKWSSSDFSLGSLQELE